MDHFQYLRNQLHCENVPVDRIADDLGTPAFVYSKATLLHHYHAIREAFAQVDPLICYSIKSCGNVHICRLLAEAGSGMDVVSGGEIHRASLAGVKPSKIVYAGVGKTDNEIEQALRASQNGKEPSDGAADSEAEPDKDIGVRGFNVESEAELENLAAIAERLGCTARAALRINPDVSDRKTHAKTTTGKRETKFGVDIDRAQKLFAKYADHAHLTLDGLHLHLGSPIYSPKPYVQAIQRTRALIDALAKQGQAINSLNIGGGFAADYESGASPAYDEYARAIVPLVKPLVDDGLQLILEPGRTIAANAGILLTSVTYRKTGGTKRFVIVDTGMHHMLRPTLYDAWQFLWPTRVSAEHVPPGRQHEMPMQGLERVDVVGPICETGDYLAQERDLPPVQRGERLAVFSAGAYGMTMASQYNAFPRPPEVLVDGDQYSVIRRRETYDDLVQGEI